MKVSTEHEARQAGEYMTQVISGLSHKHKLRRKLYDSEFRVPTLEQLVPDKLPSLGVILGWPRIVVNSNSERINLLGFIDKEGEFQEELDAMAGRIRYAAAHVHTEAFLQGVGFVTVTKGDTAAGEPEVLIMSHSAQSATVVVNRRTGWADVAMTTETDVSADGRVTTRFYVWTPDSVYEYKTAAVPEDVGGQMSFASARFVAEYPHGLGACPVAHVPNGSDPGQPLGRSELTPDVIYLTESGVRTFASLEMNRTRQDSPARYIIGVESEVEKQSPVGYDEDVVLDDGALDVLGEGEVGAAETAAPKPRPARVSTNQAHLSRWQEMTSALWEIPLGEDGDKPVVGEFQQVTAGNQDKQLRMLGQQLSAATKISPRTFGVAQSIPTSAEALSIEERDLNKKCQQRQQSFEPYWKQVGALILRALGAKDATPDRIECRWGPISTTSFSSAVDGLVKLKSIDTITDAQGDAALSILGLPPHQEELIRQERAQVSSAARTDALTEAIAKIRGASSDAPPTDEGVRVDGDIDPRGDGKPDRS